MDKRDILEIAGLIIIGIVILVVIFTPIFLGVTALNYYSKRGTCHTWALESERETKFVSNYPWYADCLTKTESGWISAYKLEQVETPNIIN